LLGIMAAIGASSFYRRLGSAQRLVERPGIYRVW
jgi:hypothetical protein